MITPTTKALLAGGYTQVCEFHYLHHDPAGQPYANPAETALRIAAAAQATGIGLTLLPVLYRFGNFGQAPSVHGQRRFVNERLIPLEAKVSEDDAIPADALAQFREEVAMVKAIYPPFDRQS